jgi:hypothetical protein
VAETTFLDAIDRIDRATLTPIVRRALGDDSAEVADWRFGSVKGGAKGVLHGISSVHRVAGMAAVGKRSLPWTVIAKLLAATPQGGAYADEALVYRSGLIADLPHSLVAPRCYGVSEFSDAVTCLWLEDVADVYGPT